MSGHNIAVGRLGENKAVDYLAKKGYIIIERNHRTPFGEIDIIAQKPPLTVFCEVKTRSTPTNGLGREAISPKKLGHMLKSAEYYCAMHDLENSPVRIDVIEITLSENSLVHFEDALS